MRGFGLKCGNELPAGAVQGVSKDAARAGRPAGKDFVIAEGVAGDAKRQYTGIGGMVASSLSDAAIVRVLSTKSSTLDWLITLEWF